jgi:hypothetical protein
MYSFVWLTKKTTHLSFSYSFLNLNFVFFCPIYSFHFHQQVVFQCVVMNLGFKILSEKMSFVLGICLCFNSYIGICWVQFVYASVNLFNLC